MLYARGNFRKYSITRSDTLGPRDERIGIESSFHIIAILATRPTIFHSVTFTRIETIDTVHARLEIQMVAINAWKNQHSFGFIIGQPPFYFASDGRAFDGVETMINISSVPPGDVIGIFSPPRSRHFVIVFTIFFRTFFELFLPPFFVILFLFLKFIMILATFWFGVVFLALGAALRARGAFPPLGVYEFFFRLRCTTTIGAFFQFAHSYHNGRIIFFRPQEP